jgi:membrane protease YdiL (CAAX protease family)
VPVTFLTMLVFVGIGEESGWTAFLAPVLLRRHGLLVAGVIAAAVRIFWHLPMMLDGELPWVLGTVGNAGFTMVTLLLLVGSGGRWSLVAVAHASLNAMGGLFFFRMVNGDHYTRAGYLLAGTYALVAAIGYVVVSRRLRGRPA